MWDDIVNDQYEILKRVTKNTALIWKDSHGIAPPNTAKKMDIAMLDWMSQLTDCLGIWIEKGIVMTDGELILARTNLGAVVESWLKFFYCVFYDDYLNNPKLKKKGKIIEPDEMRFEDLKSFSTGILWEDTQSPWYAWVDSVQHKRNAVHSFKYKEIGTSVEFLIDIDKLYEFVELIQKALPPIEDYIDHYPAGYVLNPYSVQDESLF